MLSVAELLASDSAANNAEGRRAELLAQLLEALGYGTAAEIIRRGDRGLATINPDARRISPHDATLEEEVLRTIPDLREGVVLCFGEIAPPGEDPDVPEEELLGPGGYDRG